MYRVYYCHIYVYWPLPIDLSQERAAVPLLALIHLSRSTLLSGTILFYSCYEIPRSLAITARIERRTVAGRWVRYVVDLPLLAAAGEGHIFRF